MNSPVYLEVPDYRSLLDHLDGLKGKLLAAKRLMHEIHGLRTEENHELHAIEKELEEMKERLKIMDEELYDE